MHLRIPYSNTFIYALQLDDTNAVNRMSIQVSKSLKNDTLLEIANVTTSTSEPAHTRKCSIMHRVSAPAPSTSMLVPSQGSTVYLWRDVTD